MKSDKAQPNKLLGIEKFEIHALQYAVVEAVVQLDKFFGAGMKNLLLDKKLRWLHCHRGLSIGFRHDKETKKDVFVGVSPVGWPKGSVIILVFWKNEGDWHLIEGRLEAGYLHLKPISFEYFLRDEEFMPAQGDPYAEEIFRRMSTPL